MTFLSSLLPRTVLKSSSRYNSDIRVVREWAGLKLLVNGSRQSGPYIKNLWERALRTFTLERQSFPSILVLGVGGGTVIELLATWYPGATITAVDIDSTMIAIAKGYFGIGNVPNVRLIQADAKIFVNKKVKPFDLIIVDLFIGREIPAFVTKGSFYRDLKRLLMPRGSIILNYLREMEYQKKSDTLSGRLILLFSTVRDFVYANNRFFFLQR